MFDQAAAVAAFDADVLVGAPTPESLAMLLVADPEGLSAEDATAAAIGA